MIIYLGSRRVFALVIRPVDGYDKGVSCDGRIIGGGTAIYAGSRIFADGGYRASKDLNRHVLFRIAYTDTGCTCPAFGMDDATLYDQGCSITTDTGRTCPAFGMDDATLYDQGSSITTDPCSSGSFAISICPYGSQGTAPS